MGQLTAEIVGKGPIRKVTTWRGQRYGWSGPLSHIEVSFGDAGPAPTLLGGPYRLGGVTYYRPQRGVGEQTKDMNAETIIEVTMMSNAIRDVIFRYDRPRIGSAGMPPKGSPPETIRGYPVGTFAPIDPIDGDFPYLVGLVVRYTPADLTAAESFPTITAIAGIYSLPGCPAGQVVIAGACMQPMKCLPPRVGPACDCPPAPTGWVPWKLNGNVCSWQRAESDWGPLAGKVTHSHKSMELPGRSAIYNLDIWTHEGAIRAMEIEMAPEKLTTGGFARGTRQLLAVTSDLSPDWEKIRVMNSNMAPVNAIRIGWNDSGHLAEFGFGVYPWQGVHRGDAADSLSLAVTSQQLLIAGNAATAPNVYNSQPIATARRVLPDPDFLTIRGIRLYIDSVSKTFVGVQIKIGYEQCDSGDVLTGRPLKQSAVGTDINPNGPNICLPACKPGRTNAPCVCLPPMVDKEGDPYDLEKCGWKSDAVEPAPVVAQPVAPDLPQVAQMNDFATVIVAQPMAQPVAQPAAPDAAGWIFWAFVLFIIAAVGVVTYFGYRHLYSETLNN